MVFGRDMAARTWQRHVPTDTRGNGMTDVRRQRRSVRLQGYDYAQEGAYFVTLCTHQRECLFGEIENGVMGLNACGEIVVEEWLQTAVVRPYVELDEFVVMPNHFHGILVITQDGGTRQVGATGVGTWRRHVPTGQPRSFGRPVAGSLSTIVGAFKSIVTKRVNKLRDTPGAPLWQGRFYDVIIRNNDMLNRIREYIQNNPARWGEDTENPVNVRST
jgi:putative transposase